MSTMWKPWLLREFEQIRVFIKTSSGCIHTQLKYAFSDFRIIFMLKNSTSILYNDGHLLWGVDHPGRLMATQHPM